MFCVPNYINNPTNAAFTGGIITLILFYLSSYSALLPVALFVSITISYVIYYLMGGKVICAADSNNNLNYYKKI